MEVTIEGIAAIQAGSNPRIVAQKLRSLLPGRRRAQRQPDMSRRKRRRGARGAREPRALAGHVRRHGDSADGAVHRDVRDERQVDEKKFNMLKEGLAAGFGQSTSILSGSHTILEEPGTAITAPVAAADLAADVAGEEQDLGRPGRAEDRAACRRPEARRGRDRGQAPRRGPPEDPRRRRSKAGLQDDVQHQHRRARSGGQPGLPARGLRARRGRAVAARPRGRGRARAGAPRRSPTRCRSTATPTR